MVECLPHDYGSKHMCGSLVIELGADGRTATARTDVVWIAQNYENTIVARYVDTLVKDGDRWRISRREEVVVPFRPGPPPMSDAAQAVSAATMRPLDELSEPRRGASTALSRRNAVPGGEAHLVPPRGKVRAAVVTGRLALRVGVAQAELPLDHRRQQRVYPLRSRRAQVAVLHAGILVDDDWLEPVALRGDESRDREDLGKVCVVPGVELASSTSSGIRLRRSGGS